jgi:hypothetical protein
MEFHNLYSTVNKIIMTKSRKIRCAEHVARIGNKRNVCTFLVGKAERKGPLKEIEVDVRLMFK